MELLQLLYESQDVCDMKGANKDFLKLFIRTFLTQLNLYRSLCRNFKVYLLDTCFSTGRANKEMSPCNYSNGVCDRASAHGVMVIVLASHAEIPGSIPGKEKLEETLCHPAPSLTPEDNLKIQT